MATKVTQMREKLVSNNELLSLLWNADPDFISGSGSYSDKFIGPNRILRTGVLDIDGDSEYEGLEYESVTILKGLIRVKKPAGA